MLKSNNPVIYSDDDDDEDVNAFCTKNREKRSALVDDRCEEEDGSDEFGEDDSDDDKDNKKDVRDAAEEAVELLTESNWDGSEEARGLLTKFVEMLEKDTFGSDSRVRSTEIISTLEKVCENLENEENEDDKTAVQAFIGCAKDFLMFGDDSEEESSEGNFSDDDRPVHPPKFASSDDEEGDTRRMLDRVKERLRPERGAMDREYTEWAEKKTNGKNPRTNTRNQRIIRSSPQVLQHNSVLQNSPNARKEKQRCAKRGGDPPSKSTGREINGNPPRRDDRKRQKPGLLLDDNDEDMIDYSEIYKENQVPLGTIDDSDENIDEVMERYGNGLFGEEEDQETGGLRDDPNCDLDIRHHHPGCGTDLAEQGDIHNLHAIVQLCVNGDSEAQPKSLGLVDVWLNKYSIGNSVRGHPAVKMLSINSCYCAWQTAQWAAEKNTTVVFNVYKMMSQAYNGTHNPGFVVMLNSLRKANHPSLLLERHLFATELSMFDAVSEESRGSVLKKCADILTAENAGNKKKDKKMMHEAHRYLLYTNLLADIVAESHPDDNFIHELLEVNSQLYKYYEQRRKRFKCSSAVMQAEDAECLKLIAETIFGKLKQVETTFGLKVV